MSFKVPRLPLKRRASTTADTPSVGPASRRPSSSVANPSPTPHTSRPPQDRVSLVPPSLRPSSAASPSSPHIPDAHQHSSTPVHAGAIQERDAAEDEEDEPLAERIMAVDMRDRGSIGCCYYVAAEEALYLLEDIKSGGLETIDLREHSSRHRRLVL